MMLTEDDKSKLDALFSEANEHVSVELCTRQDHNHEESPCVDGCDDHVHECSKGCGTWPCRVTNVAHSMSDLLNKRNDLLSQVETADLGIRLGIEAIDSVIGGK